MRHTHPYDKLMKKAKLLLAQWMRKGVKFPPVVTGGMLITKKSVIQMQYPTGSKEPITTPIALCQEIAITSYGKMKRGNSLHPVHLLLLI